MPRAHHHPSISLMVLCIGLWGCDRSPPVSSAPSCGVDVAVGAQRHTLQLVDTTRSTPSNGTTEELDTRELRVVVWEHRDALATDAERPVLLMAHGFDGSPDKYEAFASAVALEGIVVVAPEFPLTHDGVPGGPQPGMIDLENMPGDLGFVLDALEAAVGDPCDPLFEAMDLGRVAAMGHSLGGAVLARATRHNCCRESRIGGTIFLSAATAVIGIFFPDDALEAEGPPTLVVHGREDKVVDLEASEDLYGLIAPPKAFLVLEGTGHSEAIEGQDESAAPSRTWMQRAVIAFIRDNLGGQAGALGAELADLSGEGHTVINELDAP